MTQPRDEKLLPCPFCGNTPRYRYMTSGMGPTIACDNQECAIYNQPALVSRWNTRTPDLVPLDEKELLELSKKFWIPGRFVFGVWEDGKLDIESYIEAICQKFGTAKGEGKG